MKTDSEMFGEIQCVKQLNSQIRSKRSDDSLQLPENFVVGQAIGGRDCFFDSVAQELKRLKPEMDSTVKALRKVCKRLAIDNQQLRDQVIRDAKNNHDHTVVLPDSSISDDELWNTYLARIEYTGEDIKRMYSRKPSSYLALTSLKYGSTLQAPVPGRPDIEGQLICNEYHVKLHIVEKSPNLGYLNQVLDGSVSRSVDGVDYNEENTINIINRNNSHFEPILSTQEIQHNRQQSSNHDTPEKELKISNEEQPKKQERPNEENKLEDIGKKVQGSEEQSPGLPAHMLKRASNDPNQAGSFQQSSSDDIQSGRGTINSVQHQQINSNSPDFIDSDDEREKNTELFSAIKNSNVHKVQGLLKAGVKVSIIDKNNKDNTPLHYAIERERKEIAEKILQEWNADINAKNNKGDTPLHIATSKGNKELVQLLVSEKAKTDIKNNEYKTPLDTAKHLERQDIVQILEPKIQSNLQACVEQPGNRQQFQENLRSESNSGQGYNTQSSNQPKKRTSKQNSGKYKIQRNKRKGTTGGLDGHFYEIYLYLLGKLRGDRDTSKFYLTTNKNNLGAFDDVVMRYWKNGGEDEKSTTIFLQAKYAEDPEKHKVTIEKFTNPKKDTFYLGKYFLSYLKCRDQFNDKSKDPVFQGNSQVKYIIYTNVILDEQFDKNRIIDTDNCIFSTKSKESKDKTFKFSLDDKNSDVIATLESVSCQERVAKLLAKALVKCMSGELNHTSMKRDEIFSTYHVFLAKNVIDVEKEIKEDKKKELKNKKNKEKEIKEYEKKEKYREGKINHNFLNVDDKDLFKKVLKEEFLYEYAKNTIFKKKSSSGLDDVSKPDVSVNEIVKMLELSKKVDEDVIEKLGWNVIKLDKEKKRLKFAHQHEIEDERAKQFIIDLESKVGNLGDYNFDIPYELLKNIFIEQSKETKLKLFDSFGNISPSFKEPKHLVKQLIELFEKYKSSKIVKIDDNMVGNGKSLTKSDIKNIGKLVGNLLIFDQRTKMLRLASEESLEGDTQGLITDLKSKAQSRHLEIFSYRFDIKVKTFPRETFFTDDEDRTNVKEFLSMLHIFTGQASNQELTEIIKDEIRDLYKLTKEEVEDSFVKIKDRAQKHWKEYDDYLGKDDDFFTNIVRFNIKFNVKQPIDLFSGRLEQLKQLHIALQSRDEKAISQTACVSGLGGVGKSELARKYAYDHGNDYDGNVIWINAESSQTLAQSFLRLAQDKLGINVKYEGNQKHIKSIVEDVYGFFSKRKSLFIFDNAEKYRTQDDGDEGIDEFLPHLSSNANKPCVLITSRNQKWGNIEVIPLGTFTEKEATDFIKKALNIENDSQKTEIKKLIEILQLFPLALTLAAAYIKQADEEVKIVEPSKEFKIDDYLKEYEKKPEELLNFPFPDDSHAKYSYTTFTTWKVTIDKIKKKEYGKKALEILDILAYCAPDDILTKIFLKLEEDERKLGAAVQLLKQYSMVNLEEGALSVHRLVQQVTRINLMSKKREEETLGKALELIKSYDSKNKGGSPTMCTYYPLTEEGQLNNIEKQATYIWSYASKYDQLIKDFYTAYGEKANTPLHLLAMIGNKEAIESISENIEKGKLIDTVNEYNAIGYAPIHSAALYGHKDIVKYLIEKQGVDVDFTTRDTEYTPTLIAILGIQFDVVQYLVGEKGADPNKGGKDGQFPILLAAFNARKGLIEFLISNNANILLKHGSFGYNVLHFVLLHLKSCNRHHSDIEEIVKYLLEQNSELAKGANFLRLTPLHYAVEFGEATLVKMLLDYGADVNAKSHQEVKHFIDPKEYHKGFTPLHIAAKENHLESVKLLLQKGAIYSAINDERSTPLDIAEFGSDVENLLRSIDLSFKAILNGKKDELDNLLKGKGSDILKSILNARDRYQRTLLRVAIANKQNDIEKVLIEKLRVVQFSGQQQETIHQGGEVLAE